VELGDFLVDGTVFPPSLKQITKVEDKIIVFKGPEGYHCEYFDAIVLKKDGTYLVGKNISEPVVAEHHREIHRRNFLESRALLERLGSIFNGNYVEFFV
jgi:hypothetical protein